jgi:hypothetical protein
MKSQYFYPISVSTLSIPAIQPQNIYEDERYVGIIVSPMCSRGYGHNIVSDDRFNNANFGIAEIPRIPKPETYAMLLAGLEVLSLAVYRQKNTKTVT